MIRSLNVIILKFMVEYILFSHVLELRVKSLLIYLRLREIIYRIFSLSKRYFLSTDDSLSL